MKRCIGSLIFQVILFGLILYGTVGSDPLKIIEANLLIKIVLGILIVLIFLTLLSIVVIRKIDKDATCSYCNRDMRTYAIVLGGALQCPHCKRWYHGICSKRFNGPHLDVIRYGCKICQVGEEKEITMRLFDKESIFSEGYNER